MARSRGTANHWTSWNGDQSTRDPEKRNMADLFKRLKFSEEAAKALVEDGLDSRRELQLVEKDHASDFCRNLRKPGGEIKGHTVSTIAEHNFLKLVWVAHHYVRISRELPIDKISGPWLKDFQPQIQLEADYDHNKTITYPKGLSPKDPAKIKETMKNFFKTVRGPSGILLEWMFRDKLMPPVENTEDEDNEDEDEEEDDDASSDSNVSSDDDADLFPDVAKKPEYLNIDEEMVARAPIIDIESSAYKTSMSASKLEKSGPRHALYKQDSPLAYQILFTIFGEWQAWTNVKSLPRDPRRIYTALMSWLVGPGFLSSQARKIEHELQTLVYNGETRHYGIRKYTAKHKELHIESKNLECDNYRGYDEATKVRYYTDGIKSTHLDVRTYLSHLKSQPRRYENSFEETSQYMVDAITSNTELMARNQKRTVAELATGGRGGRRGGRGGGRGGKGGGTRPQDLDQAEVAAAMKRIRPTYFSGGTRTFIPEDVYNGYSAVEKYAVFKLRQETLGSDPSKGADKRKIAQLTRENEELRAAAAAAATASVGGDDMSTITASTAGKKNKSNDGHPALARQTGNPTSAADDE